MTLRFHTASDAPIGQVIQVAFSDEVFVTKASDTLGQSLPLDGGLASGTVIISDYEWKILKMIYPK